MRITNYNLVLDENRIPILIKEKSKNYPQISSIQSPDEAVKLINTVFHGNIQAEEHLYMIALRCDRILGVFDIGHGTIDSALISPKEIFSRLLMVAASSFLLLHNHPSGASSPSNEDRAITRKIKAAADVMSIRFLDHIIIGEGDFDYYSFWGNGCME